MSFEDDDEYALDFDDSMSITSEDDLNSTLLSKSFEVITSDDVVGRMNAEIKSVSDMLHVSILSKN